MPSKKFGFDPASMDNMHVYAETVEGKLRRYIQDLLTNVSKNLAAANIQSTQKADIEKKFVCNEVNNRQLISSFHSVANIKIRIKQNWTEASKSINIAIERKEVRDEITYSLAINGSKISLDLNKYSWSRDSRAYAIICAIGSAVYNALQDSDKSRLEQARVRDKLIPPPNDLKLP